jgi:hypothetical protein
VKRLYAPPLIVNDIVIAKLCLEQGADANAKDKHGETV